MELAKGQPGVIPPLTEGQLQVDLLGKESI